MTKGEIFREKTFVLHRSIMMLDFDVTRHTHIYKYNLVFIFIFFTLLFAQYKTQ